MKFVNKPYSLDRPLFIPTLRHRYWIYSSARAYERGMQVGLEGCRADVTSVSASNKGEYASCRVWWLIIRVQCIYMNVVERKNGHRAERERDNELAAARYTVFYLYTTLMSLRRTFDVDDDWLVVYGTTDACVKQRDERVNDEWVERRVRRRHRHEDDARGRTM